MSIVLAPEIVYKIFYCLNVSKGKKSTLADLRGAPGMRARPGSKFFHFHAVFENKIEK